VSRRRLFRLPWRTPRQIRSDVDEELSFHVDMRIDALIALGKSPDEARAQTVREFGDLEDARRYMGAVDNDIEAAQRRSELMIDLKQDLVYALRKLRAAPGFTITAIVTLALGIGANTAIFSVVNNVLLKPLPFPAADHLVRIQFTQRGQGDAGTPPDLADYRALARSFEGFSTIEGATSNLVRPGADAERVPGVRVSANFFALLRIQPLHGRFFREGEDAVGAATVVVLSEQLWRRSFGAEPKVVGTTVRINAGTFTIIGIAPAARRYPLTSELWTPRAFTPADLSDQTRGARWLSMLGRVKDGVAVDRAGEEITRISEQLEQRFPEVFRMRRARAVPIQDFTVGDLRKPLYVILAAVGFVLLIACANVANLLLVRASTREGELAIRTALGAGRARLIRQLMTESMVLAVLGAAAGVLLARLGMHAILQLAPPNLRLVTTATIDATALAVTACVALVTGIVFGVLPATQVSRGEVVVALRSGGRGARGRHTATRTKRAIVVAEVALAVTLLTGAGLMLRSFGRLTAVDPGFRPEGVLSTKMLLPGRAYDSPKLRTFAAALEQRLANLPSVQSAALADYIPFDNGSYGFTYQIVGRPPIRPSDLPNTETRSITPRYFETMGIPMVDGRGIEPSDVATSEPVAVVSRSLVRATFSSESPIGKLINIQWGNDSLPRRIVGVVDDVRSFSLGDPPDPIAYVPMTQVPTTAVSIVVRTAGAPSVLANPVRQIVRELDRDLPVYGVLTMEQRIADSVGRQRFYATLIGIFAAVALALAAIGLYGVIAYAVTQRKHELGVRVALGATSTRISRMVVTEGVALTAAGVVLGLGGALATSGIIANLLYGVTARDPLTFGGVALVLGAVAALASYLPARRAARVDPLEAMRGD